MWSSLRIRNKILLLFFVLSIVPLFSVNIYWLRTSQQQLKKSASDRQSLLLSSMAQRVNSSLDTKINTVVSTSQDADITNLRLEASQLKLLQYANRNRDVTRISLVDSSGNEKLVIKNGLVIEEHSNIGKSEAFGVVTYISNEPYISNVRIEDGLPVMTVSVPLLELSQLGDQNLTSSEALARRFGADIRGALVVDVTLDDLWESITSAKLGGEGYVYLIDKDGRLLTHPDSEFLNSQPNIAETTEVKSALSILNAFELKSIAEQYQPTPRVTDSERNIPVLSSIFPISKTKWALIGQEPVSSVYNPVSRISTIALVIFAVSIPIAIIFVLFATKTIITPIRQLTDGALRLSGGDFNSYFPVNGKDELAVLAKTFNTMGESLRTVLDRLRMQNLNLVSEQTKLQAVLDTIADGVIVLDLKYNIVLTNKTMAGYVGEKDPKNLIGRSWLEVFVLYYEDEPFTSRLLSDDLMYFHDITVRLPEDKQKYIDITALQLHNDPNGIAHILTIQDITQRRELENMKLDFVSMAAHELRTPLTAINGYLNLLGSGELQGEEHQQFVNLASSNASMLEGLINNMLSLSHIERGTLRVNRKKLDWTRIITKEVDSLKFSASAKSIDIQLLLPSEELYVWGDEVALREVLANLINNAVHYSDEGQTVRIKVVKNDMIITTTVSDDGIGIPEQSINKLFTKYYRAKGGLTTNSQGTGIGLFISKSIIDAHDGTIGVQSTFGQGSDFYFTLEAYNELKDRQETQNGDTISERSGKVDWFKKDSNS